MNNKDHIIIKGAREHPEELLPPREVYVLASEGRVYGASNLKGKNERLY